MNRPNIIFYFSDQQRADTCGCYGQKLPVTPNLDKLAIEGTLFENAFTCQPVCGPMRACLQNGKYASQTGCYKNDISLPVNIRHLADYLNNAGYDTAYIGKWHLASDSEHDLKTKPTPTEKRGGYRYWRAADVLEFTSHGYNGYIFDNDGNKIDFKGYRADKINDFALEYLDNRDISKPFFMFISQLEPHHQNDHLRFESPKGLKKKFRDYEVPGDLKGTLGDWRIQMPSYLACCNRVDYNIGRLIDKLKEKNIYEDTVIIYTSDHGCHFRTRNGEYKRSCHDSSTHVPLVIKGGNFNGKGKIKELVSLIDLPSTILQIACIDIPDDFEGKPLTELNDRTSVFMEISESQTGRAVRTNKWKYSVSNPAVDSAYADIYYEDFLYDIENDPYEKNNLINNESYNDIKNEMKKLLISYMDKTGEIGYKITNSFKER